MTAEGGSIAVDANDASDQASRDQIRTHLRGIAVAFGRGRLRARSRRWRIPSGCRNAAATEGHFVLPGDPDGGIVPPGDPANAEARAAIHEFLTCRSRNTRPATPFRQRTTRPQCRNMARRPALTPCPCHRPTTSSGTSTTPRVGEELRRPGAGRLAVARARDRGAAVEALDRSWRTSGRGRAISAFLSRSRLPSRRSTRWTSNRRWSNT